MESDLRLQVADAMCPSLVTEHRTMTWGGQRAPHHRAVPVQDAGKAWLPLCSLTCSPLTV